MPDDLRTRGGGDRNRVHFSKKSGGESKNGDYSRKKRKNISRLEEGKE